MSIAALDPLAALRALASENVQFVVIGGFAARLWASLPVQNHLEICYEQNLANCEALVRTLRSLDARLRGAPPGGSFVLDAKTLQAGDSFVFDTTVGNLDCFGTPAGTHGYPEIAVSSVVMDLGEGLHVRFASLDDLLRMKQAVGGPKNLIECEVLRAVKEKRDRRNK